MDLTPRELEVARLAAQGLQNKEIARKLGIGFGTVRNHIHISLSKLGLTSRRQLASVDGLRPPCVLCGGVAS